MTGDGIYRLADNDLIRVALIQAVDLIRTWHGIKFRNRADEEAAWQIYVKNAPEMQTINRALELVRVKPRDPEAT